MSYDMAPEGDRHDECAIEIHNLQAEKDEQFQRLEALRKEFSELQKTAEDYRRMLWVLARTAGLSLSIDQTELDSVPKDACLLVWKEPLFNATMLKGLCEAIDQPELATPVASPKCETCGSDGKWCLKCGGSR